MKTIEFEAMYYDGTNKEEVKKYIGTPKHVEFNDPVPYTDLYVVKIFKKLYDQICLQYNLYGKDYFESFCDSIIKENNSNIVHCKVNAMYYDGTNRKEVEEIFGKENVFDHRDIGKATNILIIEPNNPFTIEKINMCLSNVFIIKTKSGYAECVYGGVLENILENDFLKFEK